MLSLIPCFFVFSSIIFFDFFFVFILLSFSFSTSSSESCLYFFILLLPSFYIALSLSLSLSLILSTLSLPFILLFLFSVSFHSLYFLLFFSLSLYPYCFTQETLIPQLSYCSVWVVGILVCRCWHHILCSFRQMCASVFPLPDFIIRSYQYVFLIEIKRTHGFLCHVRTERMVKTMEIFLNAWPNEDTREWKSTCGSGPPSHKKRQKRMDLSTPAFFRNLRKKVNI